MRHFLKVVRAFFRPYSASESEQSELRSRLELQYGELETAHKESVLKEILSSALESAENKAATYLSHISIMVAIAGLFFATSAGIERDLFAVELIAYLLLALCCIRAQMNLGRAVLAGISERKVKLLLPENDISVLIGDKNLENPSRSLDPKEKSLRRYTWEKYCFVRCW